MFVVFDLASGAATTSAQALFALTDAGNLLAVRLIESSGGAIAVRDLLAEETAL